MVEEARPPGAERRRIVGRDVVHVPDRERGSGLEPPAQVGQRGKEAAREDVALNDVDRPPVRRVAVVRDDDGLEQHAAARPRQTVADVDVGIEECLPYRFDHLDRGDLVEAPADYARQIAVVHPENAHAIGKAGRCDLRPDVGVLLPGEGRRRHAAAVDGRHVQGEAAPAAADLDQLVAAGELQLAADQIELVARGLLQRATLVAEHTAGIGQRRVEKRREERVPQVIVGGDVAPAPAAAVRAQPVPQEVDGHRGARRPAVDPRRNLRVAGDDPDEGGQVGRRPPAGGVGLRGPHGAPEGDRPVGPPIANLDSRRERRVGRRPEPAQPVAVLHLHHAFPQAAQPVLQEAPACA